MAVLNIREIGDPVLRTRGKDVEKITDKTRRLIDNMCSTMIENEGIGLAAPQVGVSQRVIVLREGGEDENNCRALINPKIVEQKGKKTAEEGCLSIPDRRGLVARAQKITVKALNKKGEKISIQAEEMLARVIQHEIDHLNGVLFVDKLIEMEDQFDNLTKTR